MRFVQTCFFDPRPQIDLPQKKNSSNHNEEEDYANRGKTYKGFVLEDKATMPKVSDYFDFGFMPFLSSQCISV